MENSSKRPLPLNLNISDIFFGPLSPPISNLLYTGPKMFHQELKSPSASYNMSHSMNIKTSSVDSDIKKTSRNTFFQGMAGVFDSITNIVSKISNYTSALNNSLSVTVVPNEDIVSSEFLVRNLTANNQDPPSTDNTFTSIFGNTTNKTMHDVNNHITQVFNAHQFKNFNLANGESTSKNQTNHIYDEEGYRNYINERSDLELAIEESLKHMKNYNPCNKIDLNSSDLKKGEELNKEKELNKNNLNLNNKTAIESKQYISQDQVNVEELMGFDNSDGLEIETPVNKLKTKMRRKSNTVAYFRGKCRNRTQLRKSGVSQMKHRKERIKQSIYQNIHEDFNSWEREQNDSSEEQCSIMSSSADDENQNKTTDRYEMKIKYSTLIESLRLDDLIKLRDSQQEKSLENFKHSSNEIVPTLSNESRRLSQCSIDSDDSCFIVFEDESADEDEVEYSDESENESTDYSDESTDFENNDEVDGGFKSTLQVRFNLKPIVHNIIKWDYAYRAARKGPWEEFARDRERFRGKINCISKIIEPVLVKKHRDCIWKDRFATMDESV